MVVPLEVLVELELTVLESELEVVVIVEVSGALIPWEQPLTNENSPAAAKEKINRVAARE